MFDFQKLDKIIHEKWRLAIMALLASRRSWSFQELKAELKMSDGNLITHMRTLHKQGLVSVTKEFRGRPQNNLRIDCERAVCVSGAHQRAGGDCEGMEIVGQSAKNFAPLLCNTKLKIVPGKTLNENCSG
jgi:biotin operon repressor